MFKGNAYILQRLLGYGWTFDDACAFQEVMNKVCPVKGEFTIYEYPRGDVRWLSIKKQAENARWN